MEREVRVSPDGNAVAIRGNAPVDSDTAWGVMHSQHGGHWASTAELADWIPLTTITET